MTQPTDPGNEQGPDQTPEPATEQPSVTPQWPSGPTADSAPPPPPAAPGVPDAPTAAPIPPIPPGQPAPPAPPYGPTPQSSSSAVVALVLSIASWVVCPVIPAIVALVFANKADREIAASNGWLTGGGMVTAAKIVSWINIGLYAALVAVGLLVVVLSVVLGSVN